MSTSTSRSPPKREGPVVELAVGNGRVAVPIAVRTGRRVIGIDVSPAMLAGASERARAAGRRARSSARRHARARPSTNGPTSSSAPSARSSTSTGTTGGFASSAVWRRRSIPGGRFAWNAFVFDPAIAAELDGRMARAGRCPPPRRLRLRANAGSTCPSREARRSPCGGPIREEWDRLVEESGLEVEARFGWFDRRPFDESSREAVYVARKAT